ncbi:MULTISPECIES: hypothetical protein [Cyclobacterium]|uniref:Uncharacterized protein n=1 Tax=Cyclobacterium marinum (strain ATCC 25205 / DSM 745 / LMG 13164 / NCIMB 1802) TaxID=880070 RepID=G0J1R6_CYCMS|nr:hypothetical protein [Cyclobacterium marinum]AEL28275.1 hypothetical protein Cycma_4589 [Cyclobacterium marinum DSM 745]MBR9775251.1 hypothetical protein [Cytophagales bacterium]|tara:strand:+ start:467 stop:703 length:237 start_codon:yes stop_codon:yes gene_type:complete
MVALSSSCRNHSQNADQNHGDMMNDEQTETMEADNDHMHEDGQSDEHMMSDTTSMDMNEEMGQYCRLRYNPSQIKNKL